MQSHAILLPMLAMVAVTFAVMIRMFTARIAEMRLRRIHPQAMATSGQRRERLENTAAADNFANLFELPVLFYVLCLALIATQAQTPLLVYGAWLFVILRALHSVIHCTYNRVMHRFRAYAASALVLLALWIAFAVRMFAT